MSEGTVTAPTAPAQTAGGFMSGPPPEVAPEQNATPKSFFRDDYQKDGNLNEGWSEHFRSMGLERVANNGAKYKTEADFWKGIDHTLGFVGKKAAAGYPQPDWSPNDVSEFRRNAGIPDKPEGYELKMAEQVPGWEFNADKAAELSKWAHEHHVTKSGMEKLMEMHLGAVKASSAASEAAIQQKLAEGNAACMKEFKQLWGDEFEPTLEANKQFAIANNLNLSDPNIMVALSDPNMVRVLDMARRSMKEGGLPGNGRESGGLGGSASLQQELDKLRSDPAARSDPHKQERANQLASTIAAQRARTGAF